MDKTIFKEVNEIISTYNNKSVQIIDGLYYNQFQTIKKIEFYWNSQYINGQLDEIGRIKPFYNISKFRVNVATRATDLDVKDVRITSDNKNDRVRSMLLNHELKNWFKEADFSKLLNDFGKTRAKYGGALIKKYIETEDGKKELKIELVEWKNVITDQTDIENGVIIEVHYMSPSELSKKIGVWDNAEDAMKLATKSRGIKGNKDQASEKKIPIYEVHGEFPENYNPETPDGNPNKYQKMQFIIAGNETNRQVLLWSEVEDENPYRYLAWDYVAGRGLGVGIVEDGFEAQMWTNDAVIAEKNVMDLVGKVFIKTNSKQLGNNILSDMDNGQVIELEDGADANLLNLAPSSLPQFQNTVERWNTQYERATNTFDAVTGEQLPSNTTLGSVAIQSAQASSFFDYRREEAGIFWTEVLMDWVLPYLIKQINKEHILTSDFSIEELKMIDNAFAVNEANNRVKQAILSGNIITAEDYDQALEAFTQFIGQDGKRRYLEIPKDYFKDYEDNLTIDITGETRNKQVALQTLSTILSQVASNPAILQDPTLSQIFNEILEISGVNIIPVTQPQQQQAPQQQKQVPMPQNSALANQTASVLPTAQQ
ncbi:MAG: hypothetical protein KA802_10525 [Saprospiraceae bacterium]|nr:hypothetical protein [Saprospiraceae bacterium]